MTVVHYEDVAALDFDPEIPCEMFRGYSLEDKVPCPYRAAYIVDSLPCPRCHTPAARAAMCQPCWDDGGRNGVYCDQCGLDAPRDKVLRIVRRI